MRAGKTFIKSNWLAITILAAHFALGVLYSVAVPILEARRSV